MVGLPVYDEVAETLSKQRKNASSQPHGKYS
jgi:hypothetical protein